MNLIFGILFLGLTHHFADEKAAYQAAHDFCPGTYVERIDDRSYFECDGTEYAVLCQDGSCDVEETANVAGEPRVLRVGAR